MQDIRNILHDLQISFIEHTHPALFTAEDGAKYYVNLPGAKAKNLFLRNRKGNQHYLVIVTDTKKVDLKKLARQLGEVQLSFASPERLMKYLGLTPGSVSPFGLINDIEKMVKVIIDQDVWEHDRLNFHPNINTSTLELARDDFKKFLDWSRQSVQFIEL